VPTSNNDRSGSKDYHVGLWDDAIDDDDGLFEAIFVTTTDDAEDGV
jgi:hypothetical protein